MENELNKPLGATINQATDSVDFRLYSGNAESVVLEIFENAQDKEPLAAFNLKKNEDDIWETSIKKYALFGLKKPFYYGYRVSGEGKFFNNQILAYDPYAKMLSYDNSEENYEIKSVFFNYAPIKVTKVRNLPFADEIIAEVHMKDLTINLDTEFPGTFKAAGAFAKILKQFKVTMVEFLPLNDFDDNGNYWGYMPLSHFAIMKKYSSQKTPEGILREFQEMINEFHNHDIKVCMDVVYNHSADNASYKLIDAKNYYKINDNNIFSNNSYCGNDLKCANKEFQRLVADSISYFAHLGVDAFRFDLGLALMDTNEGFEPIYSNKTSLFANLPHMLSERGIKVSDGTSDGIIFITEPWTCSGKNCYALGKFPDFIYEWDDMARDTIRSSTLRPECAKFNRMKNLIEGQKQIYGEKSRSINYISSHDGLTLKDLNTTYKEGWEICGTHFGNRDLQNNSIKKQIALLLLSEGAVMLQLGDLISHSKCGNCNSYTEDNKTNYLDFSKLQTDPEVLEIFNFWQKMFTFRLENKPQNWQRTYYTENAEIKSSEELANGSYFAYLGESAISVGRYFVSSNNSEKLIEITLPPSRTNMKWKKFISSSKDTKEHTVNPFEIVVYIEKNA